jgi:hypothetical protein
MTTEQTSCTAPDAIIDALLEGLRLADRSLNEKCFAALGDIGRPAIPAVMRILEYGRNLGPHRNRLLGVIRHIQTGMQSAAGVSQSVLCALLDAVRSDDPRLYNKLRVAFHYLHPEVTNRLILEAFCCRGTVRHRMRLLELVGELDHQPDFRGLVNLGIIAADRRKEIAERAAKLIIQFGPHRARCGFPPRPAAQEITKSLAERNQLAGTAL